MSDARIPENKATSWNGDKMRLAKHRSLPEPRLRVISCPIYGWAHCQYDDGGSSNLSVHIAAHATAPRASTPCLLGPHDGPNIQGKRLFRPLPPIVKGVPYLGTTKDRTNSELSRERVQGARSVTTATPHARQLAPSLKHSCRRQEALHSQSQLISDCRDPLFDSTAHPSSRLSGASSRPSSVDRSDSRSPPMTVLKPSRSLKASRRNLVVGLNHNDTKKSSLNIDNDDHDLFTEIISDNPYDQSCGTSSKRFSPLPPKLRTIRRRKRLGIGRPSSSPEGNAVKPIAISLTFSSPAAPQILSPKVSASALCDRSTYSVGTDSGFDAPSTLNPAVDFTQAPGSPERRTSASLSTCPSTPLSASIPLQPSTPTNVRLGHPSRPYYSAIRKQGISPPSSRRSSIKSHVVSPTRPNSYSSPSPLPFSKTVPGSSPRHLSLSAVPHSSSFISAFAVDDESDDNVDEDLPVIPLTPLPVSGRMSFGSSLASVAKSLTRKRSTSGPSTVPTFPTIHPRSSPQAVLPLSVAIPQHHHGNLKGVFRMSSPTAGSGASGIGFSVSGEAELKMALAAQTTKNYTTSTNVDVPFSTPAIQEEEDAAGESTEPSPPLLPTTLSLSPISPTSSLQLPTIPNSPRNRIAGRVKKLTQGLKDMLLMTTHGTGNNNMTHSSTTTP